MKKTAPREAVSDSDPLDRLEFGSQRLDDFSRPLIDLGSFQGFGKILEGQRQRDGFFAVGDFVALIQIEYADIDQGFLARFPNDIQDGLHRDFLIDQNGDIPGDKRILGDFLHSFIACGTLMKSFHIEFEHEGVG